jgi:cytochrome oxidase Cu insertion factor (SCO1/SenC/PrrC family)
MRAWPNRRRVALVVAMLLGMGAVAAIAAGAAAVGIAVLGGEEKPAFRGSQPPARIRLPDFSLPDHEGRKVSSAAFRGKVVLVTFLDSQCTESCPIIAAQIGRAIDLLGTEERREVVAVAISTDPDEDTPLSVRDFLRRNRAEGRLRYLVAPVAKLRPVWEEFQISASFDTGIDTLHSAPVRIYDRDGVWVSTLHAGAELTTENLVHDVGTVISAS